MHFALVSHYCPNFCRGNPICLSIWNGGSCTFRNGDSSLKVLKNAGLDELDWARVRFEQLNLVDEKRLAVICHHQLLYKGRITRAYNKKVRPRVFKEGDLVLKKMSVGEDQSK